MRYRTPILQRVPFITRHSIFNRIPIISRVPVFHNGNSFDVESKDLMRCKLYNSYTDCSGCEYYAVKENLKSSENYKKFVLIRDDEMSESTLLNTIEFVENSGKYIRLLVSGEVSKNVVMALAYSPYNVLQFNLDLTKSDNLGELIYFARKCGVLISLHLSPIIPTVVKVSQVLSIIDKYASVVDYFCLKFFRKVFDDSHLEEFIAINNVIVPRKFLELQEGYLICSEEYQSKFLDTVNMYSKPKNINVVLCDGNSCY